MATAGGPVRVSVSAPGKVILHGEHSVVYGKTGVVVTIDRRTRVLLTRGGAKKTLQVSMPDLGIINLSLTLDSLKSLLVANLELFDNSGDFERLKDEICKYVENNNHLDILPLPGQVKGMAALVYLFLCMFFKFGAELEAMKIQVVSSIPIGAGLGSSAAFAVSVAGAFHSYLSGIDGKTQLDVRKEVCHWAFLAEKIIHGNPSGIDNSICTYGGLLSFKNGQVQSIRTRLLTPLRILLIDTKVGRNTKNMVSMVREKRANLMPVVTEYIMDAMDKVAKTCLDTLDQLAELNRNDLANRNTISIEDDDEGGCHHVRNDCYHILEQLIDTNQGLLSSLGVSHPCLDDIHAIAAENGFHAKLTGAGGGGFAFALVTPRHKSAQVENVTKALKRRGFDCWETKIATEGVTFHS